VAAFRAPFYFINLWLISDRQRNCTYLYYFSIHNPKQASFLQDLLIFSWLLMNPSPPTIYCYIYYSAALPMTSS